MADRTISVAIVSSVKSLEDGLDRAEKKTRGFGASLGTLAKGAAVGGAAAGVAILTKQLFASVDAAKESEKAAARLSQAFDAVGVSGKARERAAAKINEVSRRAALDDEDLSDTLAKLVRTTGDTKQAMEGMALAADIARARNIPLATATKAVERAYLGSDTALERLGIRVPKVTDSYDMLKDKVDILKDKMKGATGAQKDAIAAQIDQIKGHMKAAREADAQATAMDALEKAQKKFAGSSERYGKTAAGAQERFQVAVENLQESIGQKLLPVLAKLATKATEVIEWLNKHGPEIGEAFEDASRIAQKALKPVWNYIEQTARVAADLVKGVRALIKGDWSGAWDAFSDIPKRALDMITGTLLAGPRLIGQAALKLGEAIISSIEDGLRALGSMIVGKIGDAASSLTSLPSAAATAAAGLGGKLVDALVGGIVNLASGISGKISGAVGSLVGGAGAFLQGIGQVGGWIVDRIVGGIVGLGTGYINAIKAGVTYVLTTGANMVSGIGSVGGWIVDRIVNGVVGLGGGIRDKIKDGVSAVVGFGSKIVSEISQVGGWIIDKVVSGMSGLASAVRGAVESAINWVIDKVNGAISLANKAIGLANKLPGPDIPKIPEIPRVGSEAGGPGGGVRAGDYKGARRAGGGPVTARTPYLVGELGPELFVPSTSGMIVPNAAAGGTAIAAASPTIIVNFPNYVGDRRELTQTMRTELKRVLGRNA